MFQNWASRLNFWLASYNSLKLVNLWYVVINDGCEINYLLCCLDYYHWLVYLLNYPN